MFIIEDTSGEQVDAAAWYSTLEEAVEEAKRLLEDDPERGELIVMRYSVERTVTFGPDANWETQVVVLKPGEKIAPPDGSWRGFLRDREDDETSSCPECDGKGYYTTWPHTTCPTCKGSGTDPELAYELNDPKHPTYHERMVHSWDNRDKFGGRTF